MKESFRITCFMEKVNWQQNKESIMENLKMVIKVGWVSLNGKMDHIIVAVMHKVNEMVMGNFSTLKIRHGVEDYGEMGYYKVKVNILKKAKYTNVYGQTVS